MTRRVHCVLWALTFGCGDAGGGPGTEASLVWSSLIEDRGPALIYESRRERTLDGILRRLESGQIDAVPDEIIEEAIGVVPPDPGAEFRYAMEVFIGGVEPEGTVASGFRIHRHRKLWATMEDRLAVLDQRRARYGDEAMDRELGFLLNGRPPGAAPALGTSDRRLMDLWPDGGSAVVEVCGPPAPEARLPQHALYYEVAHGWDRARIGRALDDLRTARRTEVAQRQEPLLGAVAARGGEVTSRSDRRNCVTARVPKAAVGDLAADPEVRDIVVADPRPEADEAGAPSDGQSGQDGTQLSQYWLDGEAGETPTTKPSGFSDITVAVVDRGFQDKHNVLRDWAGENNDALSRVKGRYLCLGGSHGCVMGDANCEDRDDLPWDAGPANAPDHGTVVTSILVGDLTDDQEDPAIIPVNEQHSYSGYASEAGLVFLQPDQRCSNIRKAIDKAADLQVDVLHETATHEDNVVCGERTMKDVGDCQCRGGSGWLRAHVNDAFKDGVFVVVPAGNNGDSVPGCCECTLQSPADAVGAFTVGGTSTGGCNADHNDIRNAGIYGNSSVGGGEIGRPWRRSVVDVVAPACRDHVAVCSGAGCGTNEYSTVNRWGTCFAAPTVSAAAIDFKDNWIEDGSPATWLDDAHNFKVLMLLHGDRWDGAGRRTHGFDDRWGGGRLKMRELDWRGMDSPWWFRAGWTTLDDGEVFSRWVTSDQSPAPLPEEVDALKVVIWWYEPMTEQGETAADIVLQLTGYDATCTVPRGQISDVSYDTKKMVFMGDVDGGVDAGGYCWRMTISGWDVTPNDEDGGLPRRRVNWAWYYEDIDRNNDPSGLPSLTCLDPPECTQVNPQDTERP